MTAEGGGGAVLKAVARNEPLDIRRRRLRVRRKIEKHRGGGEGRHQLVVCGDSSSHENSLESIPVLPSVEEAVGADIPLHGVVSVKGRRREMEDAVKVAVGFANLGEGRAYDLYGVYDGHGGARVAEFCGERLHQLIKDEIEQGRRGDVNGNGVGDGDDEVQWEKVMVDCFAKADDEVRLLGDELSTIGSTAVVAVVGAEVVVVANCGDSRAVICRNGVAVALSEDHKPNKPNELTRIQAAGGRVINWGGYRVLGVLATSRSIGDQYLKPFVISEPEVRVCPLTNADEFLILGSDGLWDVIPNEYACWVVRRCLKGRMNNKSHIVPAENRSAAAAAVLTELAISRGSEDNISVIVVQLNSKKFRSTSP